MTREEAIKHLHTFSTTMGSGQTTDVQHKEAKHMAIEALKSEQPKGEWVEYWKLSSDGTSYKWKKCSCCGNDMIARETAFCPNCGAKMGGVDNE